jgi:hypothetical protein
MEDKELKKKLAKIPDADENGDPIYKIDNADNDSSKKKAEIERRVIKDDRR